MKHAFSLVELSIVLVILGLLTGGILTGQSLIRAAEMRKSVKMLETVRVALHTFQGKYFALPGDMNNATRFWGAQDGSDGFTNACRSSAGVGTETCNGNGDGFIETHSMPGSETLYAWEHLANAKLIPGDYTGIGLGASNNRAQHVIGVNAPRMYDDSTVILANRNQTEALNEFPINGGELWFRVARNEVPLPSSNALPRAPVFSTEEQWNIDTKMDDGRPGFGIVRGTIASSTWAPGCSTTDDAETAEYNVALAENLCVLDMYFR